ncbi:MULTISPECIES: UDP-N-acetylmuramyl pentapeptide phosphotransferase [unclassified Microbacterium]|uniref:UDP-N-acetylmuramyl pentapeptide phosphotransferase n=1 Tax=unclassified Microbacterium TaxID=2609290 RepID=UPI00214B0223|nr:MULTISPECIES: UDP-N-acetylmuramyl pentapeptide phosphotransferase [unclassified Microbacterium]MCR2784376.1 UDP-N-acetylmuramyl pentapeptide phosphotransferase [Microbacterium sp. zg.B96]MDL5350716.1 UDP-N-acetylmuramyl pentapeptide phosphotransferase [Microbacterium sp. zg-YB36]WIM14806.1 UDP-N-acetylmuramyl pentapeptide phosphotransferase [Microbacterium sp. zg-B96]
MSTQAHGRPATQPHVVVTTDPSRRPDVLFRRRTPDGHQVSAWWMIGAFLGVSFGIIGLMTLFPGGF